MKTKERILDALKRLSLQPDDDGDQVMFRYQMSNYVWAAYEVHVPEEGGLEDFVGRAVGCLY